MGGRGTFAAGRRVALDWHTVGKLLGVKIVRKNQGAQKLPEESRTHRAYVLLDRHGQLRQVRIYGDDHLPKLDVDYHPKPQLGPSGTPVLHIHEYTRHEGRGTGRLLTPDEFRRYSRFIKRLGEA